MKAKLFKNIFFASMAVFFLCFFLMLAAFLHASDVHLTRFTLLISVITPLIFTLAAAMALSLLLASHIAKNLTDPINRIDLETPDDRDVYDELKPLVQRINAQNRQLHRQMEELKQEHKKQDTLRREFTANVTHELKTPLTSISGFAEIIRDGIVKEEDVRPFAGRIYNETQRLIVLVDDIIKLSRLEDGDLPVQHEFVDLYRICEETAETLLPAANRRGISLSLTGDHARIRGIRQVLNEIVYNLCDNAIKYNHDGGTVKLHVTQNNTETVLSVADTGIGIPPEDQARVFERFYRVNKSHSKEVGGTGLGLSIVKHGVLSHNAKLQLKSELDRGTAVTIRFPR